MGKKIPQNSWPPYLGSHRMEGQRTGAGSQSPLPNQRVMVRVSICLVGVLGRVCYMAAGLSASHPFLFFSNVFHLPSTPTFILPGNSSWVSCPQRSDLWPAASVSPETCQEMWFPGSHPQSTWYPGYNTLCSPCAQQFGQCGVKARFWQGRFGLDPLSTT